MDARRLVEEPMHGGLAMNKARLRRLTLLLGALALEGCSEDLIVRVRVHGRSAQADTLWVRAWLDGTPTTPDARQARQDTFRVELPPVQGAVARHLKIEVEGRNQDGCRVALGTAEQPIAERGEHQLDVHLSEGEEHRGCKLVVTRVGDGAGRVGIEVSGPERSEPLIGTCELSGASSRCEGIYRLKDSVLLKAEPERQGYPGTLFGGWTGACSGVGECTVEIRQEPVVVRVGLLPRRACNADGWCWENPLPHGIGPIGELSVIIEPDQAPVIEPRERARLVEKARQKVECVPLDPLARSTDARRSAPLDCVGPCAPVLTALWPLRSGARSALPADRLVGRRTDRVFWDRLRKSGLWA
jgi:hypothetical protein